jgi:hypothetical protein
LSAYELGGYCRVHMVWPTLTLPKSYLRFTSKETLLNEKAS